MENLPPGGGPPEPVVAPTTPPGGPNLTTRTLRGIRWTYVGTMVGAVMQVGFASIISRLLPPTVFGILAVAQFAVAFASYFARLGLAPALIQKPRISEAEIRGCFTTGVIFGSSAGVALLLAAPLVANAVNEPEVTPVLRVFAGAIFLSGVGLTPTALLRRELRFKALAITDSLSYVLGYFVVGLSLVLSGAGIWSLVAANLTQRFVVAVATYSLTRHPVRPLLAIGEMRDLYAYGGKQSASGVAEFLAENLDTFAVTRYLGAGAGGQYSRAYLLVSLPLYYLTSSLNQVLFPGFAQLQNQRERLQRVFAPTLSLAASVLLPICAGVAVSRKELVLVMLGPQWGATAEILPYIAIANALHFLSGLASSVCEALNELNRKLALEWATLALLVGLLGVASGLEDVRAYAAALAGAELFRQFGYVTILHTVVGLRLKVILEPYGRALAAACLTGAAIAAVRQGLVSLNAPIAVILAAEILTGAVSLWANLRLGFLRPTRKAVVHQLLVSGNIAEGNRWTTRLLRVLLGRP